ncbi:MAG: GFA family protein, partial [Gammaproteobacteria bacterium]|nr:GFA family protein [Gammaproteobacteria bacterium]
HCGTVRFSVQSSHAYPFNRCYCSICRKTAGSGGFAINLGADYSTLEIQGKDSISIYSAEILDEQSGENRQSSAQRSFCDQCGSALWVWDPRWPELVHPFASAIDTELPVPPEHTHLMMASRASWIEPHIEAHDKVFERYPDESIAAWHQRLGLEDRPEES